MNIFIHYLDRELLDIYVTGKYSEQTLKKVKFSIKLALLLIGQDEYVYIPASNYFESNLAQRALEDFGDIIDLNYIRLVSSSSTLKGFVKKKEKVYPSYYTKEQVLEEREKILEKMFREFGHLARIVQHLISSQTGIIMWIVHYGVDFIQLVNIEKSTLLRRIWQKFLND